MSLERVDGRGRLFGRSVDLGLAGIYVTCVELCEIGTQLVCTVLLPGGPRRLRGRVVRLVALPRSVGIAISFTDLKEADRLVLERLVSSRLAAAQPAKLRVGGFDHDLRCEAVVGERKLRVHTALPPFLRLDASVDVGVDGQATNARGVISSIAVDPMSADGVPRLALDVDIDPGPAGPADDDAAPPSGLPRPYGHPLPSVLLSRHYASDIESQAPLADPPRRRRAGTAEIPRRAGADMPLVSPPAREPTLRLFALAAPARDPSRVPFAAWMSVPMLLIGAAIILLSRLAP